MTGDPLVLVGAENVPQATPLQPVPVTDQLTLLLSVVVAVRERACDTASPAFLGLTATASGTGLMVTAKGALVVVRAGALESFA